MMTTDRLLLDKLIPEDTPRLAALGNNRQLWKNLSDRMPHPYTEEDGANFIGYTASKPTFAVRLRISRTLIGVVGIMQKEDIERINGELGYWIGEPYWGKGYATEAVAAVILRKSLTVVGRPWEWMSKPLRSRP